MAQEATKTEEPSEKDFMEEYVVCSPASEIFEDVTEGWKDYPVRESVLMERAAYQKTVEQRENFVPSEFSVAITSLGQWRATKVARQSVQKGVMLIPTESKLISGTDGKEKILVYLYDANAGLNKSFQEIFHMQISPPKVLSVWGRELAHHTALKTLPAQLRAMLDKRVGKVSEVNTADMATAL